MKVSFGFVIFTSYLLLANLAHAKDIPFDGRLFVGLTTIDPTVVNDDLTAVGLKKVNSIVQLGVELTYPVLNFLDLGLRFSRRDITANPVTASTTTSYSSQITQDVGMVVARLPFVKSKIVSADLFGAYGGANTTFKMTSATQTGELSRKDTNGWFATPMSSYGASVALGYDHYFLVVEAGMESNKVNRIKGTGTISSSVDTLDLSGGYVTIGFLFRNLPSTKSGK